MMKELIESTVWIVPSADGSEHHAINHMGVIVERAKYQSQLIHNKRLMTNYRTIAVVITKRIPNRYVPRRKPWAIWEG